MFQLHNFQEYMHLDSLLHMHYAPCNNLLNPNLKAATWQYTFFFAYEYKCDSFDDYQKYTESFKGIYSLPEFVYSPISTADIYSMYYVP